MGSVREDDAAEASGELELFNDLEATKSSPRAALRVALGKIPHAKTHGSFNSGALGTSFFGHAVVVVIGAAVVLVVAMEASSHRQTFKLTPCEAQAESSHIGLMCQKLMSYYDNIIIRSFMEII